MSNYRIDENGEFKEAFYPDEDCWVKYEDHQELFKYCDELHDRLTAAESDANKQRMLARAFGENAGAAHDLLRDVTAELDQLRAQVGAAKRKKPIGTVTVSRFRGSDSMINTDFYSVDNLPDGTYQCYASPIITEQPADSVQLGCDVDVFKIAGLVDLLTPDLIEELHKWKNACVAIELNKVKSGEISGESDEPVAKVVQINQDRYFSITATGKIKPKIGDKLYLKPNKADVPSGFVLCDKSIVPVHVVDAGTKLIQSNVSLQLNDRSLVLALFTEMLCAYDSLPPLKDEKQ